MRDIIEKTSKQIEEDLINNGPYKEEELNAINSYGANALFYTDPVKTKFLIDVGFDIHHLDNRGRNAFFYSDPLSSIMLLMNNINPYQIDKKGFSAVDLFLISHKNINILLKDIEKFKIFIMLDMTPNLSKVKLNNDHKDFIKHTFQEVRYQKDFLNKLEEIRMNK